MGTRRDCIIILFVTFASYLNSQNKDSILYAKNELGLNISTPFAAMLNQNGQTPLLLDLTYKLRLEQKLFAREKIGYRISNVIVTNRLQTYTPFSEDRIRYIDNYSHYKTRNVSNEQVVSLYLGIEKRHAFSKCISQFYGLDIEAAFFSGQVYTYEDIVIDSVANQTNVTKAFFSNFKNTSYLSNGISYTKHNGTLYGASGFYGLMFDVSKRFYVSTTANLNYFIAIAQTTTISQTSVKPSNPNYSFQLSKLNLNGSLNIFYKF